ncbi:DUF2861 family protein [Photobacterium swingsii]|uniref:DUF2861 domain-containing protein n=1 Tax=Photobacterium swingsii TaxID=680026 RepID=A0A0J8V811_9GAMM|nr:DUF2861 family protein [Photobacterium swingsii]KMV28795.1 hypothetical protein AB733_21390 [Photobacterium swingsii]PSW24581.1 DUF2861 domain-containing protein [Photobacterium swingsii]
MKIKTLALIGCLLAPIAGRASWFPNSPLQPTLDALLAAHPQRAWQELLLAVGQSNIDSLHWQPIKNEIMAQTSCGQELMSNPPHLPATLSLAIISRSGLSSLGYQIKFSAEQASLMQNFTLYNPQGKQLLEGKLLPNSGYQEWETDDLLAKPQAGLYQLEIGTNRYPLLIADNDTENWLARKGTRNPQLITHLPETVTHCSPPALSWQWFDQGYNQIGLKRPIDLKKVTQSKTDTETNTLIPSPPSNKASYLSASASIFEYQSGVKIEYIHRVAIPFSAKP